MLNKKNQITLEEKQELEAKLDYLIQVKKPENIERLQIARSYGDLSENSEYDAAKDEQAHLDREIKELTKLLNESEVIDLSLVKENIVSIGKTVKVKFLDTKKQEETEEVKKEIKPSDFVDVYADFGTEEVKKEIKPSDFVDVYTNFGTEVVENAMDNEESEDFLPF